MKNNEYAPDKWLIVKIHGKDIPSTYKVFASWYGGYAGSNSWQMNSGITSATKDGDYWIFQGFSGSTYRCHKDTYGAHMYGQGVLEDFIAKAAEHGADMWAMPSGLDWALFDYRQTN